MPKFFTTIYKWRIERDSKDCDGRMIPPDDHGEGDRDALALVIGELVMSYGCRCERVEASPGDELDSGEELSFYQPNEEGGYSSARLTFWQVQREASPVVSEILEKSARIDDLIARYKNRGKLTEDESELLQNTADDHTASLVLAVDHSWFRQALSDRWELYFAEEKAFDSAGGSQ